MNIYWKKHSQEEIKTRVFTALKNNINYNAQHILGVPGSHLDEKVFNQDNSFLQDAPFISTLIQNPNHIGCHTLGKSEAFFVGTQKIERDVIDICTVDILKGNPNEHDGYIASGGTEANMQAIWVYRNYYLNECDAKPEEITIICSEDSHYSMPKSANLLAISLHKVAVEKETRNITESAVTQTLQKAQKEGKKYFIVVANMMTTMFGSVDNLEAYIKPLTQLNCNFKLHIDGAFGGFYYPFTEKYSAFTFKNKHISSFTLDAHKMAQAPYGTGIFLIKKGYLENVNTQEASYVEGQDFTLIGSRSGANAVAVWMILVKNGPFGWQEKIFILQKRTEWMCAQLTDLNIDFYRHPSSNIITIKSKFITKEIAIKYGLVPDDHNNPNWFKIVIMDHVTIEKLMLLIDDLKNN